MTAPAAWQMDAATLAEGVRSGARSAQAAVEQCLARIAATDGRINAFTAVLGERALRRAARVDSHALRRLAARRRALRGEEPV